MYAPLVFTLLEQYLVPDTLCAQVRGRWRQGRKADRLRGREVWVPEAEAGGRGWGRGWGQRQRLALLMFVLGGS